MKEIFNVFGDTKKIVIVAVTAAIYAGMLIPFKPIQIIPGLTELRPASVIPVLFGVLFGPAAAWGSAIGNLIADFFGMLTLGSIFGFIGNFFFSYVAYKLWNVLIKTEIIPNIKQIVIFIFVSIISSFTCAAIIGIGVEAVKLAPGMAIFLIIFINNSIMSSILGSILLKLIYKRIEKMGLIYKG